jgi:hypothetical protein
MLMPETASNLDSFSQPGKDQVRFPRQRMRMESKSVSQRVRQPANSHFWLRTFAENLAHIETAPAFRNCVNHGTE